jgi:hypothetical protein
VLRIGSVSGTTELKLDDVKDTAKSKVINVFDTAESLVVYPQTSSFVKCNIAFSLLPSFRLFSTFYYCIYIPLIFKDPIEVNTVDPIKVTQGWNGRETGRGKEEGRGREKEEGEKRRGRMIRRDGKRMKGKRRTGGEESGAKAEREEGDKQSGKIKEKREEKGGENVRGRSVCKEMRQGRKGRGGMKRNSRRVVI